MKTLFKPTIRMLLCFAIITLSPCGLSGLRADPVAGSSNNTSNPSPSISSIDTDDSTFLMKAAQGGLTEVALGHLAEDKGTSDDVKKFGAHMVMDHGNINDELASLAKKKGCVVPTVLDTHHQAMVDRLTKLSGSDFDKAYVKAMVKAHKKDAGEFEKMSNSSADPDVKAFAAKTLPMIKEHLTDIENIQSNLK